MKRRTVLKLGSVALAGACFTGGTCAYLRDENMDRPAKKEGFVLADLHCHPASSQDLEETLEMLASGLIGLTEINDHPKILNYSQALSFPNVREIEPGLLARITYKERIGYFMHTQETSSDHHILILGLKENLPDYSDAREAVEEVHRRGGIAILNHPYVVPNKDALIKKYRLITEQEESRVRELCEMVDEIEAFNAQNINPTYGLFVPNMKEANVKAEKLAKEYGFVGTAASDAHLRLEQVGICGIYLPEENLCWERIKEKIKTHNFTRSKDHYVSRWSFARGMFGV